MEKIGASVGDGLRKMAPKAPEGVKTQSQNIYWDGIENHGNFELL